MFDDQTMPEMHPNTTPMRYTNYRYNRCKRIAHKKVCTCRSLRLSRKSKRQMFKIELCGCPFMGPGEMVGNTGFYAKFGYEECRFFLISERDLSKLFGMFSLRQGSTPFAGLRGAAMSKNCDLYGG